MVFVGVEVVLYLIEWCEYCLVNFVDFVGMVVDVNIVDGCNVFDFDVWKVVGWIVCVLGCII